MFYCYDLVINKSLNLYCELIKERTTKIQCYGDFAPPENKKLSKTQTNCSMTFYQFPQHKITKL